MLWKCCTQYASKFGKLSSGHRTEKCQVSFQSQRKAILNSVQTMAQLHSSHMLAKYCSKFSKPGFHSTWTMKFQMFKLDLEKAEEPKVKFPTSVRTYKNKRIPEKRLFLLHWGCTDAGGPTGATPHSRSGGATSSKVRSSCYALLDQPWRDTPRSR